MNRLLQEISRLTDRIGRPVQFMEVCGTHTMAAFRTGIRSLLPGSVRLISGPGCPVCVTDTGYLDAAIELARRPGVIVATFGDLVRVPGSESSLEQERAAGAQVRVVYSPTDALVLAREHPDQHVVFLGVGFETTAPAVAMCIWKAAREGLANFSVLCAHKTMPTAMDALLRDQQVRIDGFLCPGHVSVVAGAKIFRAVCAQYRIPCVVAGFEGADMLAALAMLLAQVADGRAVVETQYTRSVSEQGNLAAQHLVDQVFVPCDASWRGLGTIVGSGLAIRPEYRAFDAAHRPGVTMGVARTNPACRCGDILRGLVVPTECRCFAKACTPLNPLGPCMVSSEGTCAAYYKYERRVAA